MAYKVMFFNDSYYDIKIRSRANNVVWKAVKKGTIIKPSHCELCGSSKRLEAHHHKGYARENWLDVQWLCVRCHRTIDGKRIKEARPPKLCKICGKPARRLELCETHRTRFRRYGDPLIRRVKTTGEKWTLIRDAA